MFGIKKLFSTDEEPPVVTAVIVAAGSGTRMGGKVKKQFLSLFGRPVLAHTIEAVEKCSLVNTIIIVTNEDDILTVKDIISSAGCEKVSSIVTGGAKRAISVYKGLCEVPENTEIVLIHDGVRPVVPEALIENVIMDAREHGAAALGVKIKDTIKTVDKNGFISETLDREAMVAIQTPQCFKYDIIKKAYESFPENATDDCMLVEKLGVRVKVTEGSYSNIKLTTKEDMAILSALIELNYEDEETDL